MARDYYDDDHRRYQGRQSADERGGFGQGSNEISGNRPATYGRGRAGYERQQNADSQQNYGGDQFRGHYGDETGQGPVYGGERNDGDLQTGGGRGEGGGFRDQQRMQGQGGFGGGGQRQQGGYESGDFRRDGNLGSRHSMNGGYGVHREQHQNFAQPNNQYGAESSYSGNQSGEANRGQQGTQHRDPDYHQWREEQVRNLDRDYESWRQERYQRFSNDFNTWRSNRANASGQQDGGQQQKADGAIHATPGASDAGGAVGSSAVSGKAK